MDFLKTFLLVALLSCSVLSSSANASFIDKNENTKIKSVEDSTGNRKLSELLEPANITEYSVEATFLSFVSLEAAIDSDTLTATFFEQALESMTPFIAQGDDSAIISNCTFIRTQFLGGNSTASSPVILSFTMEYKSTLVDVSNYDSALKTWIEENPLVYTSILKMYLGVNVSDSTMIIIEEKTDGPTTTPSPSTLPTKNSTNPTPTAAPVIDIPSSAPTTASPSSSSKPTMMPSKSRTPTITSPSTTPAFAPTPRPSLANESSKRSMFMLFASMENEILPGTTLAENFQLAMESFTPVLDNGILSNRISTDCELINSVPISSSPGDNFILTFSMEYRSKTTDVSKYDIFLKNWIEANTTEFFDVLENFLGTPISAGNIQTIIILENSNVPTISPTSSFPTTAPPTIFPSADINMTLTPTSSYNVLYLTARVGRLGIVLNWNSTIESTYSIYRRENWDMVEWEESWKLVNSTENTTTFVDTTNLVRWLKYDYVVFANEDLEGEMTSNIVTIELTPPQAPYRVVAEAKSDSEIMVQWSEVDNALEYKLLISFEGEVDVIETNETVFMHYDLPQNTTVAYQVIAVGAYGRSNLTRPVVATTHVKEIELDIAPVIYEVFVPAKSDEAMLWWYTVEGATEYEVQRSTNPFGDWVSIAFVVDTFYRDTLLSFDTAYYYRIKALNSFSESDWSNIKDATTGNEKVATPPVLSIEVGESSIILYWESYDHVIHDLYNSTASNYKITVERRSTSMSHQWKWIADVGAEFGMFLDPTIQQGVLYEYRIFFHDDENQWPYSNIAFSGLSRENNSTYTPGPMENVTNTSSSDEEIMNRTELMPFGTSGSSASRVLNKYFTLAVVFGSVILLS
ncbi:hypothetical protein CTEN210_16383 [Chaetoceros tenuissimus]|uniref:Fibronectin type-III domain-containing protein n=1 Tax=Chaetoceros tenuissimus TaxID=426638 RepID=A0AAD3D8K9_9STRA|nr:hypothetical protein CTEN210_16383 [Chaetoceros tenuissimus]